MNGAAPPELLSLIGPIFGGLLVLATYAVGARFGARIGVAGALLVAVSPIVLVHALQRTADLPAAALWVTAVASATGTSRRHAVWSGLAASGAIVMRPWLIPLASVLGLYLLLRPERTWAQRRRAALTYTAACAPGCVAVALIQQAFFASPVSAGDGSATALAGVWQMHAPVVALALASPALLPGPLSALFLGVFALNVMLSLSSLPLDSWSFFRALLPTIPLVLILALAVIDAASRRLLRMRDTRMLLAGVAVVLATVFVVAYAR